MTRTRIITAILVAIVAVLLFGHAAEATKVCAACGERITGKFISAQNLYYHPEHFLCYYCDKPMKGDYVRFEGHNYHPKCYNDFIALRCAYCRELIEGEHLVDYWGNAYHLEHEKDATRCEYCGRFISFVNTGGGVDYDDGRHVCSICRKTAVDDLPQAEELMGEVTAHLESHGIDVDTVGVTLHLVDLNEMMSVAGESRHTLKGYTSYQVTKKYFGLSKTQTLDVYILQGMPREQVITTLAHELTHVWQIENHHADNDSAFNEGSCNYAAWLVLGDYDGKVYEFMRDGLVENEDATYGDGLRRVKKFADEKGVDAWLAQLKTKDDFPKGY